MPTSLELAAAFDALGSAGQALIADAAAAGWGTSVPTTPGWTARDLVIHLGGVHRWATGFVRREPLSRGERSAAEAVGRGAVDPTAWFETGLATLLGALAEAPDDLDTWFFLDDPPRPRLAWARRQCHETLIHRADALAARLGRFLRPDDLHVLGVDPVIAADGVDELLTGIAPQQRRELAFRPGSGYDVEARDTGDVWTIRATHESLSVQRGGPSPSGPARPDRSVADALTLDLVLWNRLEPAGALATSSLVRRWRERVRV